MLNNIPFKHIENLVGVNKDVIRDLKDLQCRICYQAMTQPRVCTNLYEETEPCQFRCCRECLLQMRSYTFQCLEDNCLNDKIVPHRDETTRQAMENLAVKCQNHERGCREVIGLVGVNDFNREAYDAHFANCMFGLAMCRFCKDTNLLKKDLNQHEAHCPYRTFRCCSCSQEIFVKDKPTFSQTHSCMAYLQKRVSALLKQQALQKLELFDDERVEILKNEREMSLATEIKLRNRLKFL